MAAQQLVSDLPERDLCPICGASGGEPCVDESGELGQYVLDHWGRPASLDAEVIPAGITLFDSTGAA